MPGAAHEVPQPHFRRLSRVCCDESRCVPARGCAWSAALGWQHPGWRWPCVPGLGLRDGSHQRLLAAPFSLVRSGLFQSLLKCSCGSQENRIRKSEGVTRVSMTNAFAKGRFPWIVNSVKLPTSLECQFEKTHHGLEKYLDL